MNQTAQETETETETETDFRALSLLFPKSRFGKETLARACGVTKSAIETQFRNVAGVAFPARDDGSKAVPNNLAPAERQEMLAIVIVTRFASGELADDLAAAGSVAAKTRIVRTQTKDVIAGIADTAALAVEKASVAREVTQEELLAMDSKPSMRRMSIILGQSSSAMTARMKKVRERHPLLSDEEIVSKIWFEDVRQMVVGAGEEEAATVESRNQRNQYLAFIDDLVDDGTFPTQLMKASLKFELFADSLADVMRAEIAAKLKTAKSDVVGSIREAVTACFAKYGLFSTKLDGVICAYVSAVNGDGMDRIAYEMERAIDQHATWEAFFKTLEEETISELLNEVGRPNKNDTCGALFRFAKL